MILKEDLAKLPAEPGVYLMRSSTGQVLYVGKAKNLRQRVRQYFVEGGDGRAMIPHLVNSVTAVETIVVRNESEALLLENNLIKEHQPKYNILLKDDKSYVALRLSHKKMWPRLQLVRYRSRPRDDAMYFGPYTSAGAARQTLELLNKTFPLRKCTDSEFNKRSRPCILWGMKRCIAPCVGKCSKEEYDKKVQQVIDFLRGFDEKVVTELQAEMLDASEKWEFEKAAALKQKINKLRSLAQKQHVDLPKGGDTDAVGLYREADQIVICLLQVRQGKLLNAQTYSFSNILQDDETMLTSFLLQYYNQPEKIPSEVIAPLTAEEAAALSQLLSSATKRSIKVVRGARTAKKGLAEMALLNAKAAWSREKDHRQWQERLLVQTQESLKLNRYPARIDCFDNSSFSGSEPVSAMVVFHGGKAEKKLWRTYRIKEAAPGDDYNAMAEVLRRRYSKKEVGEELPDLIIIDGGKGHLNAALAVLDELDITTADVIGLAKEEGRHDKGTSQERVFLRGAKEPIILPRNSPVLYFLQGIRDEAHRFVLQFQQKRRSKTLVRSSLSEIPGIGPIKMRALLQAFGSIKKLREAEGAEILKVPGINNKNVAAIKEHFSQS